MKTNLKQLRKMYGVSQFQIAEAVIVSQWTMHAIENDTYNPTVLLASRIARFFNLDVIEIFYWPDEEVQTPTEPDPAVIEKVKMLPVEPVEKPRKWYSFLVNN